MAYTFEMIDEVITEKNDDFIELRKGEANIYKTLDLWKGDVVTLKRESGQQVLAVIIGFDEESTLMNALELKTEKAEGKYIDEATVILSESGEKETYYVNCMRSICCGATCIGEYYGTVILKDINNIAIDISVAFGLKAAFFEAPCALNTRFAAIEERESRNNKNWKSTNKNVTAIYSASLKKQNMELKQEVQVLRGKLEKPKKIPADQTDIKNLEGRVTVLTTENAGKDRRIKDLTEENSRLESKVSGLNQIIENKNRELKTSKDVGKSQRNTITANSAELKRIRNERDMLAKKNAEFSDLTESLKTEKKTAERSLDTVKNENEQLKKSVDDLTEAQNKYRESVDNLTAQISSLEAERDDLNLEVNSLRTGNGRLVARMKELEEKVEKSACDTMQKSEVREEVVVVPNTELEMRVHDLELSLKIYKELYRDVMNRLIEGR